MIGQFDESEQLYKIICLFVFVVLAEEEFAEWILEARDEAILVVDEKAIIEEVDLAF